MQKMEEYIEDHGGYGRKSVHQTWLQKYHGHFKWSKIAATEVCTIWSLITGVTCVYRMISLKIVRKDHSGQVIDTIGLKNWVLQLPFLGLDLRQLKASYLIYSILEETPTRNLFYINIIRYFSLKIGFFINHKLYASDFYFGRVLSQNFWSFIKYERVIKTRFIHRLFIILCKVDLYN